MPKLMIYGAKSLALGACLAVCELYPEYEVQGFAVSSLEGNPANLNGLPVRELGSIDDKETNFLIATPEDAFDAVIKGLEQMGFRNYRCMDSATEEELMCAYYRRIKRFPSAGCGDIHGFMAKFHKDKPLRNEYKISDWIEPIQVGAALTDQRVACLTDAEGENISHKNVNYSELTALYWIWKNRLAVETDPDALYGLFHYRRLLRLTDEDIWKIRAERADAVLPYPLVHEPGVYEHHTRYVSDSDWQALVRALGELHPEYMTHFEEILNQPYMYNYNIILARAEVLRHYCGWLFPILERVEELSVPKGSERADRYIGYLGENLCTLYFMANLQGWKIRHTGRMMLV